MARALKKYRISRRRSRELMVAEDRLTYADYCQLPEDGHRYEIIDGELYNAPAPYVDHQDVVGNIWWILSNYCRKRRHGKLIVTPIDVVFSDNDIVQPDIVWISDENMSVLTKKNLQGPPDLAIEVLSQFTSRKDLVIKKKLYGKYKVKEYWAVDRADRRVYLFRLRGRGLREVAILTGRGSFTSALFPGLALRPSEFFTR
jgi:Uma2 family endonuclease